MTAIPLHDALGIGIEEEALIATVGGGGKTTLLFALAAERASRAGGIERVSVLTTTTKFTVPREGRDVPLVLGTVEASRAAAIEHAWSRGRRTVVVGSGRGDRERVLGVDPGWPRRILEMDIVGLVGVEADGSAGRPFKAPAEHEPVIPEAATHVVAVVGAGVLGRPLHADHVHRPERVSALTGLALGDALTATVIAGVLAAPEGGRKDVPDEAAFAVVISGAGRVREGAQAIAQACATRGVDRVVSWDAQAKLVERFG